jgi:HrpA-like RNA helicase
MRTIWQSSFEQRLKLTGREKSGFVYKLRTNDAYRAVLWGAKRHVLTLLSAILIVYLGSR